MGRRRHLRHHRRAGLRRRGAAGNGTGVLIGRGTAEVRSSAFAGNTIAAVRAFAPAKVNLHSSTVRNNTADGVLAETGAVVHVRDTRFLINGAEPIEGNGAPAAPTLPRRTSSTGRRPARGS